MGTYTPASAHPTVTSDDLGVAGRPDYPTAFSS